MQQFQMNPNFYGNYMQPQQQYNPYMQRMENLQQFQQAINQPVQQTQISGISGINQFTPLGKIVESVDMVKATDIPMDGSMYYFPTADGSLVFGKQWLPNGQTRILTFKPQFDDGTNISSNNEEKLILVTLEQFLEGIQNDIKVLNEKIDKISKPTRAKKGESEDE